MGKFAIGFRVASLVGAFVAVLITMHYAQNGSLEKTLSRAGFAPKASAPAGQLNLCATRIQAIQFPDGWRLYEEGREWRLAGAQVKTLDSVEVEKWLARHCQVDSQLAVSEGSGGWEKLVTIEYVNGGRREIQKRDHHYSLDGVTFISAGFEGALGELRHLPEKSGHP